MKHVALVAALLVCASTAHAKITPTALDAITRPGQPVTLRAKFESAGWLRLDMRDELVEFTVSGQVHQARTDRQGVARIQVTANVQPGVYAFSARVPRKPRARWAQGRIFVLDPARPLAIVDVDGTISKLPSWLIPIWGKRAKAYDHAPEVLRALARSHQVVYLTARDDLLDRRTRAFLNRRGFPDGPLIFDLRQRLGGDHAAHKLRELTLLQAKGFTIALGLGDKDTDAQAYVGAGVLSYIHTDEPLPAPSVVYPDYPRLEARLIADGILASGGGLTASFPPPN